MSLNLASQIWKTWVCAHRCQWWVLYLAVRANWLYRPRYIQSIMAFGQLWGLVTCHSYGAHGMRVSFPVRQMLKLLSQSISKNIERLSYAQRLRTRKLVCSYPISYSCSFCLLFPFKINTMTSDHHPVCTFFVIVTCYLTIPCPLLDGLHREQCERSPRSFRCGFWYSRYWWRCQDSRTESAWAGNFDHGRVPAIEAIRVCCSYLQSTWDLS